MDMTHFQQNQIYQHIFQEMNYIGVQELAKQQLQYLKSLARELQVPENQKKMDLIQNIMINFVKCMVTSFSVTIDNPQMLTFKTNINLLAKYSHLKTIVEKYNDQCQTRMQMLLQQQLQQQFLAVAQPNMPGVYLFGNQQNGLSLSDFQNAGIPYLNDRVHQQQYIPQQPIQQDWKSLPIKPRQTSSQSQSQQANLQQNKAGQSIVNQECICANSPALAQMLTQQDSQKALTCHQCFKLFHCQCLRVDHQKITKTDRKLFECPRCILKSMDPLNEVQSVLVQPCITEEYPNVHFFVDKEMQKLMLGNPNLGIEIRCVKIEGAKNNHEITWPDLGCLIINGKKVYEFKPLQINSALKKRKDDKFFCRDNLIRGQENSIICKKDKATAEQKLGQRIDEKALHMWGVFLVKKLSAKELIEKTMKQTNKDTENNKQCKLSIENVFAKQQDGLQIDKIQINLLDPYDFQLIKTPAKGKYCTHLNCFSLENLIMLNETTVPKRWKCPICKSKCYEFVIDTYQQEILKEVKEKPNYEDIQEVIFSQNGQYEFKVFEDNENSQQSQQSIEDKNIVNLDSQQKQEDEAIQKEKLNNQVIILDSDEEHKEELESNNEKIDNKATNESKLLQQQLTDEQVQQIYTEKKISTVNQNSDLNVQNISEIFEQKKNELNESSYISDLNQAKCASQECIQDKNVNEDVDHPVQKKIKKNNEIDNLIQIDD